MRQIGKFPQILLQALTNTAGMVILFLYIHRALVCAWLSMRVKREAGVNPAQDRYCDCFGHGPIVPPQSTGFREGRGAIRISQETCQQRFGTSLGIRGIPFARPANPGAGMFLLPASMENGAGFALPWVYTAISGHCARWEYAAMPHKEVFQP